MGDCAKSKERQALPVFSIIIKVPPLNDRENKSRQTDLVTKVTISYLHRIISKVLSFVVVLIIPQNRILMCMKINFKIISPELCFVRALLNIG